MSIYYYTYLITNLLPMTSERYYIGSRQSTKPPEEDIKYHGSSKYLTRAIRDHGISNFEKIILHEFSSRTLAHRHEAKLHKEHNVRHNEYFYNRANAGDTFHVTAESNRRSLATRTDPDWKATKGKAALQKEAKTKSDPIWINTVLIEQKRKEKATKTSDKWLETVGKKQFADHSKMLNDPKWKETVGKERNAKKLKTISDPIWKETIGKEAKEKELKTKSNPFWKDTVLVEMKVKMSAKRLNPDWIKHNLRTCEHCGKELLACHYAQWHGDNCKNRELHR